MTPRRFVVMLLFTLACAVALVWLHCQEVHLCYRIDELREEGDRLTADCARLDARVSHLSQPHLLAQRVETMQLGMVSRFEELPPVTGSVQLVAVGDLTEAR